MDYTENLKLKKPKKTDFYNVKDFNDNMDIIDMELEDTGWIPAENTMPDMSIEGPPCYEYEYRRVGKRVEIRGSKYGMMPQGGATITIPIEFTPSQPINITKVFPGGSYVANGQTVEVPPHIHNIVINPSGVIVFSNINLDGGTVYQRPDQHSVSGLSWFID